jgi:two-component system, NtrC family, response regulator AtoC
MRGETILVVDDEKLIRWSLVQQLQRAGFRALEADAIASARRLLHEHDPDLVLLDQMLPDGTGIELLTELRRDRSLTPVVMLTGLDRAHLAVQAMKLGAFEYVTKPVDMEELLLVIEKALEETRLRRQVAHFLRGQEQREGFCGMIGSSTAMREVFDRITRVAESRGTTVLVTGESGTGKELVARAVHFLSSRKDQPLMTVNCSALSETLIESELFGHEKGAFTDARVQKKGIFELASGGTVFLDEIGDISPKIQVKLLRVLETKTFQRVGGSGDISVDIRVIAATNQPLETRIQEGTFRSDLYFRLNVAQVHLPPLRERGDDALRLAECFLQEFTTTFHRRFRGVADDTRQFLLTYHWPGNVRELRNAIERAVLLEDDELLYRRHLGVGSAVPSTGQLAAAIGEGGMSLDDLEKEALRLALLKAGNNKSAAARLLKIGRDELRYKIKKHGLDTPSDDSGG